MDLLFDDVPIFVPFSSNSTIRTLKTFVKDIISIVILTLFVNVLSQALTHWSPSFMSQLPPYITAELSNPEELQVDVIIIFVIKWSFEAVGIIVGWEADWRMRIFAVTALLACYMFCVRQAEGGYKITASRTGEEWYVERGIAGVRKLAWAIERLVAIVVEKTQPAPEQAQDSRRWLYEL